MRILYVTTIGATMSFFKGLIRELIDDGHIVDIATNETDSPVPACYRDWGCRIFHISCSRAPLKTGNAKAVRQIRRIVRENGYDIVHCHTPIAAACTRLACRKLRKKGLRVIYTAHGFHFYKGAPKKNWLLYYPIEKLCARWTDVLITINREDYALAQKKLKAQRIEYVPGVGIDTARFHDTVVDKVAKRVEIGVPENAFLLLSVGELNQNKNHQIVIRALGEIGDTNIHYIIAGQGDQRERLMQLAKEKKVNLHLLGYRTDVAELYRVADAYVLPSIREGLNVSIMEAMAAGLPVICSWARGNQDMIGRRGFDPCDINDVKRALTQLPPPTELDAMFSSTSVNRAMRNIYSEILQQT